MIINFECFKHSKSQLKWKYRRFLSTIKIPEEKRNELIPAIENIKKFESDLLNFIKSNDFDMDKLKKRLTH